MPSSLEKWRLIPGQKADAEQEVSMTAGQKYGARNLLRRAGKNGLSLKQ
jgi:hypothetical protein